MIIASEPKIGEVIKYPLDIDISANVKYHIPANTPGTIVEIWEHPKRNDIWLVQVEFKIIVNYRYEDYPQYNADSEEYISIYATYSNPTIVWAKEDGIHFDNSGSNISLVEENYFQEGYQEFMEKHGGSLL